MNRTGVGWTDYTQNVWSGCKHVSPGCKYCYADTLAERKRGTEAFPDGFGLTVREHKLEEPLHVRRPSLVFVESMSDFFLEEVDDRLRDAFMEVIRATPWHRYQILTKRSEKARNYFSTRPVPDNVWLGVSIEGPQWANRALDLFAIDAPVKFVSAEPLLDDLGDSIVRDLADETDWIIPGGESGGHLISGSIRERRALVRLGQRGEPRWVAREDRKPWIRRIRDRFGERGKAVHFKQWGGAQPMSAGRELDGVTLDGMPTHVPGAMPEGWTAPLPKRERRQTSLPLA